MKNFLSFRLLALLCLLSMATDRAKLHALNLHTPQTTEHSISGTKQPFMVWFSHPAESADKIGSHPVKTLDSLNMAFDKEFEKAQKICSRFENVSQKHRNALSACLRKLKGAANKDSITAVYKKGVKNLKSASQKCVDKLQSTRIKNMERINDEIAKEENRIKANNLSQTIQEKREMAFYRQKRNISIDAVKAQSNMISSSTKMLEAELNMNLLQEELGKTVNSGNSRIMQKGTGAIVMRTPSPKVRKQSKRKMHKNKRMYDRVSQRYGKHKARTSARNDNEDVLDKPAEDVAVDAIIKKADTYMAKGTQDDINWAKRLIDAAISCYPHNKKLQEKKESINLYESTSTPTVY